MLPVRQGLCHAWFSIRKRRGGFSKYSHSHPGFHFHPSTPSETTIENTEWKGSLYLIEVYFLHSSFPSEWNGIFMCVKALLVNFKTAFNFTTIIVSFRVFYYSYYWPSFPTTCAKFSSLFLYTHPLVLPFKDSPSSLPESSFCHCRQCLEPAGFQHKEQ